MVKSSESTDIKYGGTQLTANSQYFWRVRVWDAHRQNSSWSKIQSWGTALFQPSDWQAAKWIGRTSPAGANPAPFVRKPFVIDGKVKRATAFVCGLGYADIHLNGALVAQTERDPGYTNFDKRLLYVAYDLTAKLHQGPNALGAVLGTGWYDVHDVATWHFERAPWRARPKLKLLLSIEYANGRKQVIRSDETWKCSTGPLIWDGIYTGEMYDARRELPGWDTSQFNDSKWKQADVLAAPKGVLVARHCAPIVSSEQIAPKAVTEPVPGIYIVDFGQNIAGHVRLTVKSRKGQSISMRYSERIDRNGMIQRSEIDTFMAKSTPPQPFQTDIYVCKGAGPETYEQRFAYSGFRYVELIGVPHKPDAQMVQAIFSHTDLPSAGKFASSNELLNKIQRATLYSYQSNAQSILTDCPQREKNGWTGDAQLACEAGLMNFQSRTLYEKWLDDLSDDQDASGQESLIIPSNGWGHGGFNPAWDSAYHIVANDLYDYCGNASVLAKHYSHLTRYVDALFAQTSNGTVPFDSLGDWVPWSTTTPSQLSSTVYLYHDALLVAKAAKLLHKTDDIAKYENIAHTVRDAFNQKFYDQEAKGYANNSQTANAMALYFGLVPAQNRAQVLNSLIANLEKQGHLDTGILGAKYVLRVLSESGRTDLAYKIVSGVKQPSWGWWINQGATTLWEDWKGESSLNHIMFGDVSNWFYQWIAGIGLDPASPGFSHFFIRPQAVGDLTWASAEHMSPHGMISSSWRQTANGFTLKVVIPANTSATVSIPGTASISEAGVPISKATGISNVHSANGATVFEAGSGTYTFVSNLPTNPR